MSTDLKISADVQQELRCPICRDKLDLRSGHYECLNAQCEARFPVIDGIPVLINDENSVFAVDDFVQGDNTTFNLSRSPLKRLVDKTSPEITKNLASSANYESFAKHLLERSDRPKVLVVGGSVVGHGMEPLFDPRIELVETDVSFGPRTSLICDGHDLPLEDNTFDGAIAQAVLEHVADPYRCTEELHRVLKPNGVVYADTPFMQHGHMGAYDFTRFTHLGHRRLFRAFKEIDSGIGCGPGTAFAWAYQNFLLSFSSNKRIRTLLYHASNVTSFQFKYLDKLLNDKPSAYNTASSHYFLGSKSDQTLSDRELVTQFRGLG